MRSEVVVFKAVIWSRTSFWFPSACATMTAVRRAEMSWSTPDRHLDQLDVVLDDDVDGEIALDRTRAGSADPGALTDVEQHVLAQRFRTLGVGDLHWEMVAASRASSRSAT